MKILFTILSIILFAGCNSTKKVLNNQKEFQKIGEAWAKQNPCDNDTTIVFKPGRIDTLKLTAPLVDNTFAADSIAKVLSEKYHQDIKQCQSQVKEAYNAGYMKASADWSSIPIIVKQPDSSIGYVKDRRQLDICEKEKSDLQTQLVAALKDAANYKTERNTAYIILLMIIAGAGILSYFKFLR